MDNNNNHQNNDNDTYTDTYIDTYTEIRKPDPIRREQLLQDTRSDYEKQLEKVLQLSMQEYTEMQCFYENAEEKLLKEFNDEKNRREELFKPFLTKLTQLRRFDADNKTLYDILENIIEKYCLQQIEKNELDEETYNAIFAIIKNVRIDKTVFNLIQSIIIKK
jgi:hypothetical protein